MSNKFVFFTAFGDVAFATHSIVGIVRAHYKLNDHFVTSTVTHLIHKKIKHMCERVYAVDLMTFGFRRVIFS